MAEPECPTGVHEIFRQWSSPTRSSTKSDNHELHRLTEVTKAYLKSKFVTSFEEAGDRPLVLSDTADGTPVQAKVTMSQKSASSGQVRSGNGTHEYFVQNCFLLFKDASGCEKVRVLLRDPLPMARGKALRAAGAIALDFVPDPRDFGHAGLIIRHASFDRGQFSALQKFLRRWHIRQALKTNREVKGTPAEVLFLLDWSVQAPCSLHDVHKSLAWSMQTSFASKELIENVFVFVESCKQMLQTDCRLCSQMVVGCPSVGERRGPSITRGLA